LQIREVASPEGLAVLMKFATNGILLPVTILTVLSTRVLSEPKPPAVIQNASEVIRGVVTRVGTSEPIPGVLISATKGGASVRGEYESAVSALDEARARGVAIPPAYRAELDAIITAGKPLTTRTDSAGRFVITGVSAGPYFLTAEREGYMGPERNLSSPKFVGSGVTVATGVPTPELEFSLIPGAVIRGRVSDSQGRPVVGASVLPYQRRYLNGAPVLYSSIPTVTDDRGEYQLRWLPPGDFYVGVDPASLSARGTAVPSGVSDARTYYPGTVDISSARLFVLRGGEDLSGMNIVLQSSPRIKISGRVTSILPLPSRVDSGGRSASPPVAVTLVLNDKNAIEVRRYGATVSMDNPQNGQFEITGILPGSYDIYATVTTVDVRNAQSMAAVSAGTQPATWSGRTSFEAGSRDLTGLSVVLRPGVEVKVHVTVDGDARSAAGAVRVGLEQADSANSVVGGMIAQLAGPDGSITMPFVKEGFYRFQVSFTTPNATAATARGQRGAVPNLSRAYVEDIREGNASIYDGIRIGTDMPHAIEVLVRTNGGSINGSVVNAEQKPMVGAIVVTVPNLQRRQIAAFYKTATSNAAGRFVISGLAPGEYKLFAWESVPPTAYRDAEFLANYEDRGRAVTVSPGASTTAEITVIPAGQ